MYDLSPVNVLSSYFEINMPPTYSLFLYNNFVYALSSSLSTKRLRLSSAVPCVGYLFIDNLLNIENVTDIVVPDLQSHFMRFQLTVVN